MAAGKRVWVIGTSTVDAGGKTVETGDALKGNEVLPKLISVFTDVVSGKWGDYTLELEEVAPQGEDSGDRKSTRTVKATFKFNVKTQAELIEALRNIQTIEKLFQYFQELSGRAGASPSSESSGAGGGAALFDRLRDAAAALAALLRGAAVEVASESIRGREPADEADPRASAPPAEEASTELAAAEGATASAALGGALSALQLRRRRFGDAHYEADLYALMEALDLGPAERN